MKPFPYAIMSRDGGKTGTTMRLKTHTQHFTDPKGVTQECYYRDNGSWHISFEIRENRIFTKPDYKMVDHLKDQEFFEISKSKWAEENLNFR